MPTVCQTFRAKEAGTLSSRVALATPAGERYDPGLLLIALLVLEAALDVAYLGTNLPAAEIVASARRANAVLVGVSLVCTENRTRAVHEVQTLQRALPVPVELWLGR